jgi:hypothetical protein
VETAAPGGIKAIPLHAISTKEYDGMRTDLRFKSFDRRVGFPELSAPCAK